MSRTLTSLTYQQSQVSSPPALLYQLTITVPSPKHHSPPPLNNSPLHNQDEHHLLHSHQAGKEHIPTGRAHELFQESEAATQLQALGTSGTLKLNSLVKMLLVIITNLLLLDDR
jgi:hypothetical protein